MKFLYDRILCPLFLFGILCLLIRLVIEARTEELYEEHMKDCWID